LKSFLHSVLEHPAFRTATVAATGGARGVVLSGLTRSAKAFVVAGLAHELRRPLLVLTQDNESADHLQQNAGALLGWLESDVAEGSEPQAGGMAAPPHVSAVSVLPAFDCSPYEGRSPHAEICERRAVALWNVARGSVRVLVTPLSAALGRFREVSYYRSLALELRVGDEVSLEDLIEHLTSIGYEAREPANNVGLFSVRGGLFDVYPPEAEWPLRLEFFGDQIESVREFDPTTQRSRKAVTSALLLPLTEATLSAKFFADLIRVLVERSRPRPDGVSGKPRLGKKPGEGLRRTANERPTVPSQEPAWASVYSNPFSGREFFAPLVEPHRNNLLSLFDDAIGPIPHAGSAGAGPARGPSATRGRPSQGSDQRCGDAGPKGSKAPLLVWDEPLELQQLLKHTLEAWANAYEEVRDMEPPRPRPEDIFLAESEFWQSVESLAQIGLKELSVASRPLSVVSSQSSVVSGQLSVVSGQSPREAAGLISDQKPGTTDEGQGTTDKGQRTTDEFVLLSQPAPKFHGAVKTWIEDARARLDRGETLVLFVSTSGKAGRLCEILQEYGIPFADLVSRPTQLFATSITDQTPSPPAPLPQGGEGRSKPGWGFPLADDRNPDPAPLPQGGEGRSEPGWGSPLADDRNPEQALPSPPWGRGAGGEGVCPTLTGHGKPGSGPRAHPIAKSRAPSSATVLIARADVDEGMVFPELGLILLTDRDLFGGLVWGPGRRRRKSAASSFISDLSDLKVGDYVVHIDHGIGLYQGLRPLEVGGTRRDFMLITYLDDAKLYVPLERLDLVEKYRSGSGVEGTKTVLDRMGGVTWARTKMRVKRALRDMAEELLRLYAARKMSGGSAFSPDSPWQKEFEETPDQLTALADIKRDLERSEPMDRLLCGDVGYGKTELAMRAAFKVVQDSRQVAMLAPTTVLAFQHFNTFRQRMVAFPIRVEMLSRFRSAAEQKKIVSDLEAGRVDIVVGTHRLLSKDVGFRDLGLLVVDEEQRFGVAAKEKLKKLRANVDVLTLSATPIPRTLHMSLGGLRDLSVIETPPRGRLAIQTIVAPFSDALVQAAILPELERQGQVFFVHNRVESIFSISAIIQRLVPTARIGVSHGQMGERELEKVMMAFVRGEYDVLVATSIIENGLDIPRANSLIVNHAERFGLADLYQLRGRVGRSDRRAYAYFLIPDEETLTPIAKRRLAALKEFSDLGAGFRLAALDLELRGTGNRQGAEQSGHMNSIGLDLYLKMLEQTVEELKGTPPQPEVRTALNLGLDIKIPETFIADESQRLRMYKRITSIATAEERADMEEELIDRYGPIPSPVVNLLNYARLKSAAEKLLIQSVERKGDELWVRFHPQAPVDPEKLMRFVRRHRESSLRPDGILRFRLAQNGDLFDRIQNALQELHA
jgi:transcription-repair coupling factor